jgi:hypothetical protein
MLFILFYRKNNSYIFYNKIVKKFLLENYSIIPSILTPAIVQKFIVELKTNSDYQDYYMDWIDKNEMEKVR